MKLIVLLGLVWLGQTAEVFAAPPKANNSGPELLRLVDARAGLCIEFRDLDERLPAFLRSEFHKRLENSMLYRRWQAGKDARNLSQARHAVERLTGKPFARFAKELFGSSVVLAISPTAGGRPAGVLLTRTAGEDVLDSALDAWNRAEPQRVSARSHSGTTYFRRTKPSGEGRPAETLYYLKLSRVFALSDRETMIQRVIDLHLAENRTESSTRRQPSTEETLNLFDSPTYRKSRRAISSKSFVSIYFNPRVWDSLLVTKDGPTRHAVLRALWRRCESIVAGVRLDQGVVVEVVASYDNRDVGEMWQQFVSRAEKPAGFLDKVPRYVLMTMAGRFDFGLLERLVNSQVVRSGPEWSSFRQVARGLLLGLDPFDDVLARFDENWAGYVMPRKDVRDGRFPVDALLAVELRADVEAPAAGRPSVSLQTALDNALNTGLNLLAAVHNRRSRGEPAVVRSEKQGLAQRRWLDSIHGYQPAYAITPQYLVIASSPQLVAEFFSAGVADRLVSDPVFQKCSSRFFPDGNQILFFNLSRIRKFLEQHRDTIVRQAAKKPSAQVDEIQSRLAGVEDILRLFDGGFVAARLSRDHIRLVIGGIDCPSER